MVLISSLYLIGTFLLIPGCALYLPDENSKHGTILFIIGCGFLPIAALLNMLWNKSSSSSNIALFGSVCSLLGGICFELASILYWPAFNSALTGTWIFRFGSCFYLGQSICTFYMIFNNYNTQQKQDNVPPSSTTMLVNKTSSPSRLRSSSSSSSSSSIWRGNESTLLGTISYSIGAILYIIGGYMSQYKQGVRLFAFIWLVASIFFVIGSTAFLTGACIAHHRNK